MENLLLRFRELEKSILDIKTELELSDNELVRLQNLICQEKNNLNIAKQEIVELAVYSRITKSIDKLEFLENKQYNQIKSLQTKLKIYKDEIDIIEANLERMQKEEQNKGKILDFKK